MSRLKVYGMRSFRIGTYVRLIVAAPSKRAAAAAFGIPLRDLERYGSETGNSTELEVATRTPGEVFWRADDGPDSPDAWQSTPSAWTRP